MCCNDYTTLSLQVSQLATILTQMSAQASKDAAKVAALEARVIELEERMEQRVMTLDATK